MRGRSWAAIGGIFVSLALSATASAQTYTPGGRTLGDVLPELGYIGNTGYDAQNYDLTLNYDPVGEHVRRRDEGRHHAARDAEPVGVRARLPRPERHRGHDRRRRRDVHA